MRSRNLQASAKRALKRATRHRSKTSSASPPRPIAFMGGIDTIVVSAGAGGRTPIFDTDPEEFQRIMDHTLRPAFLAVRYACSASPRRRPRIGHRHLVHATVSSASASGSPIAGRRPASSAWSRRWRSISPSKRVRVNAMCPGFVETPLSIEVARLEPIRKRRFNAKRLMHPIPRAGTLRGDGRARCLPRLRPVRLHDRPGDRDRWRLHCPIDGVNTCSSEKRGPRR